MQFIYKARQVSSGHIIRGKANYSSEYELKQYLISMQLVPIWIKVRSTSTTEKGRKSKIPPKDLAFCLRQLAITTGAGMSMGSALELVTRECSNSRLKVKLEQVYGAVISGKGLARVMEEQGIFSPVIIGMLEAAEWTGRLDKTLSQAADYMENQLEIRQRVHRALLYPSVIIITLIIAIGIILTQVIPGYVEMFMQVEVNLPESTKIIIRLSDWLGRNWGILLSMIGLVIFFIYIFSRTPKGKIYQAKLELGLPMIGRLNKQLMTARWSECMALLLASGIPIVQAIEQSQKLTQNMIVEKELSHIVQAMRKGHSLSDALQMSSIFPEFMVSMVRIGEETGSLDEIFVKIGDYFNKQLKGNIDKLIVMIEPTLTIIIALIVGFMMFAIVTPTFTLAAELM